MLCFSCRRYDLALTMLLALAGTAHADDISIVSDMMNTLRADFANPDIPATEALIDQNGGANSATIDQSVAGVGNGNYAEINQNGSSNQVSVVQAGDSNRARIGQTGSSNSANTTQSGSGNTIDLSQTGDANLFQASQTGNNNSIVASQMGLSTTTLSEDGNNNSITANLSSPGLNVDISIVGDGMSVSSTQ